MLKENYENSKHQIANLKQIPMTQIQNLKQMIGQILPFLPIKFRIGFADIVRNQQGDIICLVIDKALKT